MQQKSRLHNIDQQLNRLNNIILMSKNQNEVIQQVFKNCQSYPSSSSSIMQDNCLSSNNISRMFQDTCSRDTIVADSQIIMDSLNDNESVQISQSNLKQSFKNYSKSGFGISRESKQSKVSENEFKVSGIKYSQHKLDNQANKIAKLSKIKIPKSKPKQFFKETRPQTHQKKQKIQKVKSQKKILQNISTLKTSINFKKQSNQKQSIKKCKINKTSQPTEVFINLPQKTYTSSKIQTLNSKRNIHQSIKKQKNILTYRNSNNKYNINLQKQVKMKITDLKLQKKLYLEESKYLQAALKINQDEINELRVNKDKNDQAMFNILVFKTIANFIQQFFGQSKETFEYSSVISNRSKQLLLKERKTLQTINKLPDILRFSNFISEFHYKEFIESKLFIQQQISSTKNLQKSSLLSFMFSLYSYIQFLFDHSLISLTKKQLVNKMPEKFYSDRKGENRINLSAHDMKYQFKEVKNSINDNLKQNKFLSKKKDFSQRKNYNPSQMVLKHANANKILKKSTTSTKSKIF